MLWWLAAAGAWLVGVAWQVHEPRLWPVVAYASGTCAGGLALALSALAAAWRASGASRQGPTAMGPQAPRWARWAAVSALALLAWGSTGWRASDRLAQRLPPAWVGRDVGVTVQVAGLVNAAPFGETFDAQWLDAPTGLPTQLVLRLPPGPVALPMPMRAGQRWRMTVRLHEPDGLHNPGGHDPTLGAFQRGVRAVGVVRWRPQPPALLDAEPAWPWQGWIDRRRQDIRAQVQAAVADPRAAGVLSGLAVGDQSAIASADWELFRRTGVAHLVSISGTHIAMVGCLLGWCVRRAWARLGSAVHWRPAPSLAVWSAVMGAAAYAGLAGWGVPAQRTVWMMATVAMLRTQGRRWPTALVWLCTAVPVTVWDPWALRQPGFWLSYVAVAILLASGDATQALPTGAGHGQGQQAHSPWWRRAGQASAALLRTQWLVVLALSPLALVCFQQVSVVGFVANLWAVPLFTWVITPLALLGVLCSAAWTAGAWFTDLALAGLAPMARMAWAVWPAPAVPGWVAALAVCGAWLAVVCRSWPWRVLALALLLPLLCLPPRWHLLPAPPQGHFEVLSADVGQGTAVLVRTAHHSLLFDTGGRVGADLDMGTRALLPLFQALGVDQLDTLVISHQDTDHVGGAAAIVSTLPVRALVSSLASDHPLRAQLGVNGHALPHTACVAGLAWQWDGVQVAVLHPTEAELAQRAQRSPNALSCVLRVSRVAQPARSALLTGDIEAPQERALLARLAAQGDPDASSPSPSALRSTLLLAPHHGSQTSSTEPFLRAVAPAEVLVQVGARNRYGHPSSSVMARYRALGLSVRTSPDCGAHVWSSQSGTGWCWRHSDAHPWDAVFMDP